MKQEWGDYKVIKDLQGYLELDKIEKLIQHAKKDRDKLIILLLSRSGRRITEVLGRKAYTHVNATIGFRKDYPEVKGITPRDVNWETRMIAFNILKKKSPLRKLKPIDKRTLDLLRNYIDQKGIGIDEPIFKIGRKRFDQIIKEIAEDAGIHSVGIKKLHAHHLRHSYAVNALRSGANIRQVQQALEHSNINITSGYLQFDQKELRKVLEIMFDD